jgi:hypothetical protein
MGRSRLLDVDADGVDLVGSAANRRSFALFKAEWTTAYVNSLPDSSFAYVEPGAKDDKSKRHLPYKDAKGNVDLPHLRNALARLDQTDIPAAAKAAARRKLEAAAKAHGVGSPAGKSTNGGAAMTVETTKAAFRTHLEKLGVPDAAELTDEELVAKAAAAGYELIEKQGTDDPAISPAERSFLGRLMKLFGRGTYADADDDPLANLDKSEFSPAARAIIEGLTAEVRKSREAITALTKSRETDQRIALTKRVEALRKSGWLELEDEEAAKITEAEVAAIEKARERVTEKLKKAGVLESFGDVQGADDKVPTLKEMVAKAVRDHLGREPLNKMEEVRTRKMIYEANPGLAQAVRDEERAAKVAGTAQ